MLFSVFCESGQEVDNSTGTPTCVNCPVGTYKDNTVDPTSKCTPCPGGKLTPTTASDSINDCSICKYRVHVLYAVSRGDLTSYCVSQNRPLWYSIWNYMYKIFIVTHKNDIDWSYLYIFDHFTNFWGFLSLKIKIFNDLEHWWIIFYSSSFTLSSL